jgi:hypothetical protein
MNKRGNIMISMLIFIMALGVMIAFIGPINDFIDIAQQSDGLNCKGYIHNGNPDNVLSFNETSHGNNSGSPVACLALKLYLPYILLVFLIGGISAVLGNRAGEMFGFDSSQEQY